MEDEDEEDRDASAAAATAAAARPRRVGVPLTVLPESDGIFPPSFLSRAAWWTAKRVQSQLVVNVSNLSVVASRLLETSV